MKKILILGGARAQIKLIDVAKSMGIYTIVVGIPGDYPGYKLADKYYPVDIFDREAVLEVCMKEKIDGVSMVCSDYGLMTLGYICDKLKLRGISEYSASISSNKLKMKELFIKYGINTAKYQIIRNKVDIEDALICLSFPMIVKAVDLQGSKGVYIVNNEEELIRHSKKAIELSNQNYCIVEEYIIGKEYGAQAFVYNGDILFILPHGDILWDTGKTNIPIGHYFPAFKENSNDFKRVFSLCKDAIGALKLNNCAVNIDYILKDGVPYILELAGRVGANYLPELVSEYIGLDYYKMILLNALDEPLLPYFSSRKDDKKVVLSRMIFSQKTGKVQNITYPECVEMFVNKGDYVYQFTNSKDCIGQTLCSGCSLDECNSKMNKIINNIKIDLL